MEKGVAQGSIGCYRKVRDLPHIGVASHARVENQVPSLPAAFGALRAFAAHWLDHAFKVFLAVVVRDFLARFDVAA